MKLSQFGFHLPKELLAEHPAKNREDAKLMVLDRKKVQSQTKSSKTF